MDNNDSEKKQKQVKDLINNGSDIAGGAIGTAIGFLFGGLAGATIAGAGGVAAAIALKKIGQDISERHLSPREKVRIGGVLAIAAQEIQSRLEAGEKIRNDGFFKQNESGRSDADEVLESVLLKCQREPEEKKLPYMSHLPANITFDPNVSVSKAHQLIKAGEQITYRQLCLLKLSVINEKTKLRSINYQVKDQKEVNISIDVLEILYECYDLYQKAFLNFGGDVLMSMLDITPCKMHAQGFGVDLIQRMNLVEIPNNDLIPMFEKLKE